MKLIHGLFVPLAYGLTLSGCDVAVGDLDEELNPAFATAAQDAAAGVEQFHEHFSAGDYGKIWDESRQSMKDASSKEDWVATMENMASVLGAFLGSEQETLLEESYQ